MDFDEAVRRMPKAEMHFHFEGAFRWSTVRELHPRGRELPEAPPWHGRNFAAWEEFTGVFRDFLKPVTGTPEAVERHAFEELEDLARQNVRYVELIVSHTFHTARGMREEEVWEAVVRGRARAEAAYGIRAPLFLGISRDQAPASAEAVFAQIAGFALKPGWLAGIDLQSDERARTNADFAGLYRAAAGMGLKLRAHAGELGGPRNVRDAVELCGVRHVSHGVRAAEDPALLADLARDGVWLHVCPASNVRLRVCENLRTHPLRDLLAAGVRCTVSSDDPLLFDTDITREFLALANEMAFTPREVADLAKNGFRSSLLPAAEIEAACAAVDSILPPSAL